MKRLLVIFLGVLLVLACFGTAYAITGNDCEREDVEFQESGTAVFILDNAGKICGTLKPCEDIGKLGFQHSNKSNPQGLEDGKAIRRRKLARVRLDEELQVIKGGTALNITVILTDMETVEEIVGEELTVQNIIDATIYSPNLACDSNTVAAHIFLTRKTNRFQVGTVKFCNGKCLKLYAGNFDCDCDLELGFTAVALEEPEPVCNVQPQCPPKPPCPAIPCTPCTPCVNVTTTTTTSVTTTTTTTTTVGSGSCKK